MNDGDTVAVARAEDLEGLRGQCNFREKHDRTFFLCQNVIDQLHHHRGLSASRHAVQERGTGFSRVGKRGQRCEGFALLVTQDNGGAGLLLLFGQTSVDRLLSAEDESFGHKRFDLRACYRTRGKDFALGNFFAVGFKEVAQNFQMRRRAKLQVGRSFENLIGSDRVDGKRDNRLGFRFGRDQLKFAKKPAACKKLFECSVERLSKVFLEKCSADNPFSLHQLENLCRFFSERGGVTLRFEADAIDLLGAGQCRGGHHCTDGVTDRAERHVFHKETKPQTLLAQRQRWIADGKDRLGGSCRTFGGRLPLGDKSDLRTVGSTEGNDDKIALPHLVKQRGRDMIVKAAVKAIRMIQKINARVFHQNPSFRISDVFDGRIILRRKLLRVLRFLRRCPLPRCE